MFVVVLAVSTLINSEPIKSFVSCKTVCFSNVSMAKELNSVNYCLVTCTEHAVNVISTVVCYKTACPVNFDIVVETINVTLLSTYRFVSLKVPHCISPTVISISKLPLHLARPPATLSVWSSPSSASSPPSPSTYHFSKIPFSSPLSLLLPTPPSPSSSQSALSLSPSSSSASPSQSTFFFPSPPSTSSTSTPSLLQLSATLPLLSLSPSPLRKSVSCNYCCAYNSLFLQTALMFFITLLFNVILNFQSTKMILGFTIFSIFILVILIYAKFFTKFSLNLTYNITQHR